MGREDIGWRERVCVRVCEGRKEERRKGGKEEGRREEGGRKERKLNVNYI